MSNCRFKELHGGKICDGLTGRTVANVPVENMDTHTAARVVDAVINGLHAEFGPMPDGKQPLPSPKK